MSFFQIRWVGALSLTIFSQVGLACPGLPNPVDTQAGLRYSFQTQLLTAEEYLLRCKTQAGSYETQKMSESQIKVVTAATAASTSTAISFGVVSSALSNAGAFRSRGNSLNKATTQAKRVERTLVASADKSYFGASEASDGQFALLVSTKEVPKAETETNIWVSGLHNQLNQDYSLDGISSISRSRTNGFAMGFDRAMSLKLTVGASIASDRLRSSLDSLLLANTQRMSGEAVSLAPYFSYQLTENLSVDGVLGIGTSSMDGFDGAIRKSSRSFGGLNFTYSTSVDGFLVEPKLSLISASDRVSSDSDPKLDRSKINATQIRAGAQVTYLESQLLPFVGINLVKDTNSALDNIAISNSIGTRALAARIGVSYDLKELGFLASLFAEKEFRRDFQDSYIVSISLGRKL